MKQLFRARCIVIRAELFFLWQLPLYGEDTSGKLAKFAKMTTLITFDDAVQAHLLKSKLKSEGIAAFVFDENIVTLNRLYSQAVGGVKVMVSQFDEIRARQLLRQLEIQVLSDENGNELQCPRCASVRFYVGFKSVKGWRAGFAFAFSLFFVVYPFYFESVKRCMKCGHEVR